MFIIQSIGRGAGSALIALSATMLLPTAWAQEPSTPVIDDISAAAAESPIEDWAEQLIVKLERIAGDQDADQPAAKKSMSPKAKPGRAIVAKVTEESEESEEVQEPKAESSSSARRARSPRVEVDVRPSIDVIEEVTEDQVREGRQSEARQGQLNNQQRQAAGQLRRAEAARKQAESARQRVRIVQAEENAESGHEIELEFRTQDDGARARPERVQERVHVITNMSDDDVHKVLRQHGIGGQGDQRIVIIRDEGDGERDSGQNIRIERIERIPGRGRAAANTEGEDRVFRVQSDRMESAQPRGDRGRMEWAEPGRFVWIDDQGRRFPVPSEPPTDMPNAIPSVPPPGPPSPPADRFGRGPDGPAGQIVPQRPLHPQFNQNSQPQLPQGAMGFGPPGPPNNEMMDRISHLENRLADIDRKLDELLRRMAGPQAGPPEGRRGPQTDRPERPMRPDAAPDRDGPRRPDQRDRSRSERE